MNTTFDVLVIVLSCLLGIFLLISITTAVLVLKLVKAVRNIVAKGEGLIDSAEELRETLKRNAGAVGVLKSIFKVVDTINKTTRRR